MIIKFRAEGEAQMKRILDNYESGMRKAETSTAGFSKGSNQATAAMTDFSRVMQDAPYGIRGVANNLNPMFESFQRLSKEAGGASGAFKAMVASLASPAGVGIAIAAVSSGLVMFSDYLQKNKKEVKENTDALDDMSNALDKVNIKLIEQNINAERANLAIIDSQLKDARKKVKDFTNATEKEFSEMIVPGGETMKNFIRLYRDLLPSAAKKGVDETVIEIGKLEKRQVESSQKLAGLMGMSIANDPLAKGKKKKSMMDDLFFLDVEQREKVTMNGLNKILPQVEIAQMTSMEKVFLFARETDNRLLEQKLENEKIYADFVRAKNRKIYEDNKLAIDVLHSGFMGLASGVQDGLTKAFRSAFGEANSLLEMFALSAGQQLIGSLAGLAIGSPGGGGIIGSIFSKTTSGGASKSVESISMTSGKSRQPIIVNLQIGRKEMRAIVSDAQSENVRLRLA